MDWNHTTYIASERYLFGGFKVDRVLRQSQQSLKCTDSAAVPLCFKRHLGEGRRQNRKLLFTAICYYCPPQTCAQSMAFMPDSLSHMTGIFFSYTWCSQLPCGWILFMNRLFFFSGYIWVLWVHSFMVKPQYCITYITYYCSYKYWILCVS